MPRDSRSRTINVTNMLSSVVLLLAFGGLFCQGVPVAEQLPEAPATESAAVTTTTATSTITESAASPVTGTTTPSSGSPVAASPTEAQLEGHLMDDLLPGSSSTTSLPTSASPATSLNFLDTPQPVETTLGSAVLLACRTTEPVAECQWSWRPLPPTSLPLPNIDDVSSSTSAEKVQAKDETTNATLVTAAETSTSLSLPVSTFPAFGNTSSDCSVRFSSIKHEQTGYWTCAARRSNEDSFTSTAAAKLSIVQLDKAVQIKFRAHHTIAVESPAGSGARLPCRTQGPVQECQWSWRQLNQSRPWDVEMRRFPPAGNDSTDCELGLPAVHSEDEGFWTCGARHSSASPFVQTAPIRLLISEVEFVQLSRGIQIATGETVFLRCLVNKPVYQCEWSLRSGNTSTNSTLLRQFSPAKDNDHDCSLRFKIAYEEEGLWTCGVRLTPDGILHEAPSTTVSLLLSGKVNFTETPESTSVALGSEVTLRCATNGRVSRCAWSWRPLNSSPETEPTVLHEFQSHDELGRNCSLSLAPVGLDEQGYWTCQVYVAGPGPIVVTPNPAKLTVYKEEEVRFSELSKDIQITSGGTVSLRCVTTERVEKCRWSLTSQVSGNTTVVVKQFEPMGPEARDCSVKLSHALQEQEGLWTCGARMHARQNYTDAPPARLSLIEPDPITVTVWGMPHQMANLACKMGIIEFEPTCLWKHGSELRLYEVTNATRKTKYTISMNHSSGVCSLQFVPDEHDFGEWICEFWVDNEEILAEFGSASILLLNNSPDQQLSWLVGAITSTILFLLIIAVVVVVYRSRNRRIPTFLETMPVSNEPSRSTNNGVGSHERYTHNPTKINLSYANPNFLASNENINNVLPNRSPHLYERVSKRDAIPKPYENIRVS